MEERLSPTDFAKQLRKRATHAERMLWEELRGRKLGGFKFTFQTPLGKYTADFCCRSHRLVVEVDGASHLSRRDRCVLRDLELSELGYIVIRFEEVEIQEDLKVVLLKILDALEKRRQFRY